MSVTFWGEENGAVNAIALCVAGFVLLILVCTVHATAPHPSNAPDRLLFGRHFVDFPHVLLVKYVGRDTCIWTFD